MLMTEMLFGQIYFSVYPRCEGFNSASAKVFNYKLQNITVDPPMISQRVRMFQLFPTIFFPYELEGFKQTCKCFPVELEGFQWIHQCYSFELEGFQWIRQSFSCLDPRYLGWITGEMPVNDDMDITPIADTYL